MLNISLEAADTLQVQVPNNNKISLHISNSPHKEQTRRLIVAEAQLDCFFFLNAKQGRKNKGKCVLRQTEHAVSCSPETVT